MKVIFLDKDGVLNSDEYFDKIEGLDVKGVESDVDVQKVKLLKEAVDATGAKVVLTASARYTRNAQHLIQLLSEHQILVDLTPYINNIRGIEIRQWLEEHPDTEDFVILDDEIFDSYDEELMKKLIKISNGNGISFGEGLQPKDVEEIIQRLGRKRQKIDGALKKYIEENVLPQYNKNEKAHGIEHIHYVIRRSFELIKQNDLEVNNDMVYVIAAYHDIGHHIDRKKHELISAEIMWKDEGLKQFFTEEELTTIRQAIEDHRASSDHEPRSIYGKIVSSADRNNTVEQCLERPYYYGKRQNPKATDRELYEDSFKHLNLKFGVNGYAKFFLKDEEYEKFLEDIRKLLQDKEKFCKIQAEHIRKLERKNEER